MSFHFASVIWLILIVVFIITEAVSAGLVSIWFAIGAAAAFFVSAFTESWLIMFTVFVLVSAVTLLLTRPLVKKHFQECSVPTNAELNIGKKGRVITAITPDEAGRVRLDGVDWRAHSSEAIPAGALCVVLSVDGASLEVRADEGGAAT